MAITIGLILDVLTSIGSWFGIIALFTWIYAKIKKKPFREPWAKSKKAAWILGILAAISILVKDLERIQQRNTTAGNTSLTAQSALDALSSYEKERFRDILKGALQSPDTLTSEQLEDFHSILKKIGITTSEQMTQLREFMTGVTNTYQRYFWEDALSALKDGRPFKSMQRERYEKYLLSQQIVTEFRIKENEVLIEKISRREPVPLEGQEVVLNEMSIREILGGLAKVNSVLDKLFSGP